MAGAVAGGGLAMGQLIKGIRTIFNLPEPTSGILIRGSPNVFTNSRAAIRAGVDTAAACGGITSHIPFTWPTPKVAEGSSSVFINGFPAARLTSKMVCGAHIKSSSPDVSIGGDTVRVAFVWDLESWLDSGLKVLGLGALIGGGAFAAMAGWAAFGSFAAVTGVMMAGFEGLGQLGDSLGPGYRDLFQGVAGMGLLLASPKMAKTARNKAIEPEFKNIAEQRINEINNSAKSNFPNGRKPAKTSVVKDRKTGKIYQDDSGWPVPSENEINPKLSKRIPDPSLEKHDPNNCAEFKAVNKALNDGADINDLDVYTMSRNKLTPAHRCKNCLKTTKGINAISD
jgi:uncharacterized Zn-binding protein involved in type VI secretion